MTSKSQAQQSAGASEPDFRFPMSYVRNAERSVAGPTLGRTKEKVRSTSWRLRQQPKLTSGGKTRPMFAERAGA
jgi:hypothetical protein